MSWSKSISLDVANKLFDVIGVSFEQNELEGGYVAKHENKILKRPTLTASCMAVLTDWVTIKESLIYEPIPLIIFVLKSLSLLRTENEKLRFSSTFYETK